MGRYLNSSTSYVLYKGQTEQPYFVDKSQMLSELFPFLDSGNTHICITRPRRFGKTVMANMITAFLGKKQDSDSIFKSLKISQNDLYNKYRNQYNVISIDFSKMPRDCDSYTDYIDRIETNLIRDLRKEYPQIEIYEDDSAADVLETIFEECDQQRFVFVLDEWDFIFHKDFVTEENKKQYVLFLSNLLKDRSYVQLTYMTGILPIAKYSSGSELNMFWEYTMASEAKYNEYFGFTQKEVEKLLRDAEMENKLELVQQWYDGYHFGDLDIYCPWDVLNYVKKVLEQGVEKPENFWEHTSDNAVVEQFLEKTDFDVTEKFETLLSGNYIKETISENLTYNFLTSSEENLWSLLYMTGYLTKVKPEDMETGDELEEGQTALRIPNAEVTDIFRKSVVEWFHKKVVGSDRRELFSALWNGDAERLTELLSDLLFDTISFHDYAESFYHAFVTGLVASAGYIVESNYENGLGRSDIVIKDRRNRRAAVIEAKIAANENEMEKECGAALSQIEEKQYARKLERSGFRKVIRYGIAFYKKECLVRC